MRNSTKLYFFKAANQDHIQCSENLAAIPHDKICRAVRAMGHIMEGAYKYVDCPNLKQPLSDYSPFSFFKGFSIA